MKAMIQETYGSIEGLHASDIEMPAIGAGDVLIRVRAAAVHIGDVFAVQGSPVAMRMATGLLRPAYGVPGFDVAGIVESVGADVTRFRPGDEVFGMTDGATAEFARAAEAKLAPKPASLSFEEAAAITTSASAALQGLRDAGKLQPGQKVLINGASGGVGTFAVQIAKAFGADVTGVTSTPNVELVRSLGADRVIDYTTDRLHDRRRDVRPHLRQHREPVPVGRPPGAEAERNAAPEQRPGRGRPSRARQAAPAARPVAVRTADAAPLPVTPERRGPRRPRRPRRPGQAAAGDRQHVPAPRDRRGAPPRRGRPRPGQGRHRGRGLIDGQAR